METVLFLRNLEWTVVCGFEDNAATGDLKIFDKETEIEAWFFLLAAKEGPILVLLDLAVDGAERKDCLLVDRDSRSRVEDNDFPWFAPLATTEG